MSLTLSLVFHVFIAVAVMVMVCGHRILCRHLIGLIVSAACCAIWPQYHVDCDFKLASDIQQIKKMLIFVPITWHKSFSAVAVTKRSLSVTIVSVGTDNVGVTLRGLYIPWWPQTMTMMATRCTMTATALKMWKSNGVLLRNRQICCEFTVIPSSVNKISPGYVIRHHGLWPSLSNPTLSRWQLNTNVERSLRDDEILYFGIFIWLIVIKYWCFCHHCALILDCTVCNVFLFVAIHYWALFLGNDMCVVCMIVAIFSLYLCYFLQLNMFTTLRYLGLIGLPTFLCGNKLLSSIAAKRYLSSGIS